MRDTDEKGIFAQPGFYLAIMFLIITAQVFWWLMFFASTRFALVRAQDELDIVLWKALNGEMQDLHAPPYFRKANGRYELDESVILTRRHERDRNLMMLWAEASFFIGVFGAGAMILVRLHRKQRRLASERELFLNSFTHELKTPLAAIKLNLQTLQRRPDSPSRRELLDTSLREVEILNRRISDILLGGSAGGQEGVRAGSPELPRDQAAGCLATLVLGRVLHDLHSTIRESGARIEASWLPPVNGLLRGIAENIMTLPSPEVLFRSCVAGPDCESEGLERLQSLDEASVAMGELELGFVLSGLLTNALVYGKGKDGIVINVSFQHRGSELVMSVADAGPGIPWSERRNIFRPLVRLQQTQGFVPGTGMGLFNIQELCRRAGGAVRLCRAHTGARFEVRLPVVERMH